MVYLAKLTHWPPFDAQHAPVYCSLAATVVALFCLYLWWERREHRQKVEIVRGLLASERCARCGGMLSGWDERFYAGDAHFSPGGELPVIRVQCHDCHAAQTLYASVEYHFEHYLSNRDNHWGD